MCEGAHVTPLHGKEMPKWLAGIPETELSKGSLYSLYHPEACLYLKAKQGGGQRFACTGRGGGEGPLHVQNARWSQTGKRTVQFYSRVLPRFRFAHHLSYQ